MIADATTAPAPIAKKESLSALIEREKLRTRRRRLLLTLVAAACVAVAIAIGLVLRPRPVPFSARFRVARVGTGDIVREVRATGHLEAVTTVQVGAEVSGRIATVEADYNDRVIAGQVLARFDRASLEAQAAQAGAALAAARAALEQAKTDRDRTAHALLRTEALFLGKGATAAERDEARATAKLAEQRVSAAEADLLARQAAHQLAKTNLEHTVIRAPIDGIVITRNIDPGQTVASALQTPVLFTVAADLRKMEVIASVDEADIGEVSLGQPTAFSVSAYPNRVFEGVVTKTRNSPQIVQDVVTYGTEVEVENLDFALKPGMTASVRIRTASAHGALHVPTLALSFVPPGAHPPTAPTVWTLQGDTLRAVVVQPGVSDGEFTVIAPGALVAGQPVIIELTPAGRSAYGIAH